MIRPSILALGLALLATPALAQSVLAQSVLAQSVLAQSAPAPASGDNTITLTFDTAAETGAVMVALYNSAEAYEGGAVVGQARIDVAAGQRTATFPNLPAGDYAAKAFHDVDGDGEMGMNPFGMPTEPYGFSNNAVGNMGPARWNRASFAVSGDVAQTINLR